MKRAIGHELQKRRKINKDEIIIFSPSPDDDRKPAID